MCTIPQKRGMETKSLFSSLVSGNQYLIYIYRKETPLKKLRSSFWLHSIFYTFLQRFSLFFFGVVSYIILVRALLKDENAVWSLYLMILMIFETMKQGLLRNPTIKFLSMPEYANSKNEVQYSALIVNILFSALALIGLFAFGPGIASLLKTPELLPLLWWSSLLILLFIPFNHCEVMLQANYKFSSIFWGYFIRQGSLFAGIVILYFGFPAQFTLLNLLYLQVAALFLGVIVLFINARPFLVSRLHFNRKIITQMLHFGKYIFGTNLTSNLVRSFDQFITANVLSPAEGKSFVAYYNVIFRINTMMDVPSLAVADVLFPKSVETLETDGLGKVKYYFERMIATILAVIIPACLFIFIFPKFVVHVLAGPAYYAVIPLLQMTILFSIMRPIGYLYGSTLDSIGKPKVNFWSGILFMAISLATNYICLRNFGGTGAAYATMINGVISLVLMTAILKKYIHLEIKNVYVYWLNVYKDAFRMITKFRKTPATPGQSS
jgi:lipopolysaccharide exporter